MDKRLENFREILGKRLDVAFGLVENVEEYGSKDDEMDKVLKKMGFIINYNCVDNTHKNNSKTHNIENIYSDDIEEEF